MTVEKLEKILKKIKDKKMEIKITDINLVEQSYDLYEDRIDKASKYISLEKRRIEKDFIEIRIW